MSLLGFKVRIGVIAGATLSILALCERTGEAAVWNTCNGQPVKWNGTLNVTRKRCTIPDSGTINSAYWNGVKQWNDLSNRVDNFYVHPVSNCTIQAGNGTNEVGRVARSVIDGANGMTWGITSWCVLSSSIIEADVLIADDLFLGTMAGWFHGTVGRSTFVHEFGHFFGFEHDTGHAIMRTSPPHLLTGLPESSTLWPRDSVGMFELYAFATGGLPNLLPSALGVVSGSVVQLNPAGIQTICRGQGSTRTFYLGNMGAVSSGTYSLRLRLRDGQGIGLPTYTIATFNHSFGSFSQWQGALSFTVPSHAVPGDYFVDVEMDHNNAVAEFRENDNKTSSARMVRVVSC